MRGGKTLSYGHDGLNRVRTKTVPVSTDGVAGYSLLYGYDVRGLQTFAQFGSGAGVTNQYDGFGWLRSSSTTMDCTARPVTYAYDAYGVTVFVLACRCCRCAESGPRGAGTRAPVAGAAQRIWADRET